jgi:uncharacterized protein (DUF433 family)
MTSFITSNPEIMGGMPCVAGTRIPVSQILFLVKQGYKLKEIQQDYSWVELSTLEGVMQELAQKYSARPDDPKVLQTQTASR